MTVSMFFGKEEIWELPARFDFMTYIFLNNALTLSATLLENNLAIERQIIKLNLIFLCFFPIGINTQYEDVPKHFKQQNHLISKMKKKSKLEWCFKFHFCTYTHFLKCESLWHVRLYKNQMLCDVIRLYLSSGSSQTLCLSRLFLWHHPTVVISIKEKKDQW